MSNSTAAVRVTITAGSRSVAEAIAPTYNAISDGIVDVPDATTSATAITIPFGGVGVGASLLWVKNKAGQDMILKVNGSLAVVNLPDGGCFLLTSAALPAATKLTSATLTTTATVTPAGTVEYLVAGDPV